MQKAQCFGRNFATVFYIILIYYTTNHTREYLFAFQTLFKELLKLFAKNLHN